MMSDCDQSMIFVIDARPGVTIPAFRRNCGTRVAQEVATEPLPTADDRQRAEASTVILKIATPRFEVNTQVPVASQTSGFTEALSLLSIEATPDAFVAVDLDNRIANWN